jgi:manganese/iron transport system permease protein
VVLISREAGFQRDLSSLLFGNVLGVSWDDVWITLAIEMGVLAVLFALLKEFTLVAFDSTLAKALGYPVFWLDVLLLLLVAGTIVAGLQAVGNILVLALVVTPAAAARLLTDRLWTMMAFAAAIAMVAGVAGLFVSYHADTAAGGTIVIAATVLFLGAWVFAPDHGAIAGWLQRRRGRHHVHHYHPLGEEHGR